MTTISRRAPVDAERVFSDNLGLLDHVVRGIGQQHGLSQRETDELVGALRMKLAANDFELLRRFAQRSSLRTYLLVLVERHLLDLRSRRRRTAESGGR